MLRRTLALGISIAMLALMVVPAAALVVPAAAPTTTISLDPPVPSGLNGWWSTAPIASLTSNQDSTIYYGWGPSPDTTVAATAGNPIVIGPAPEGVSILKAYAVNGTDETETPAAQQAVTVDSLAPDQPTGLAATPGAGPTVALDWNDVSDNGASGMNRYTVYRNLTGPPFSPGEAVGNPTTSDFIDSTSVPIGILYYAVAAYDNAGNQSLLSDAVTTNTDSTPPTAPSDLRAWKNASQWARVLWTASTDIGSGLAHYRLERSIDGGPMQVISNVPPSATFYNDFSSQVATAGTIHYQVTAVDRAGLLSSTTGPVLAVYDGTSPVLAGPPSAIPVYSEGMQAQFDVGWTQPTDTGSGFRETRLRYGPASGAPNAYVDTVGTSVTLNPTTPSALWYFTIQAEDEAGNLSAISAESAARYVSADRVFGDHRITTSLAVSNEAFDAAGTVLIASAWAFPDALCASGLAGQVHGPVILVGGGPLPAETLDELERLGVTDAYVVGGTGVVSAETLSSLQAAISGTVTRLAGPTRYETASQVASEIDRLNGSTTNEFAFVVSGRSYADALSAGSAAYVTAQPVLFATSSTVPWTTSDTIESMGIPSSIVVGGTGVVTAEAESVLSGVERIAGINRYATSRAFAQWAEDSGIVDYDHMVLVTGANYPDGLSAAPLAGEIGAPVLLTSDVSKDDTTAWMQPRRTTLEYVQAVGGTGAISDSLLEDIWGAISIP